MIPRIVGRAKQNGDPKKLHAKECRSQSKSRDARRQCLKKEQVDGVSGWHTKIKIITRDQNTRMKCRERPRMLQGDKRARPRRYLKPRRFCAGVEAEGEGQTGTRA